MTGLIAIAQDLCDRGRVKPLHYRVWRMHTDGHTIAAIHRILLDEQIRDLQARPPSMNKDLGKVTDKKFEVGDQRGFRPSTMSEWCRRVQVMVEKEELRLKELGLYGPVTYGHSCHEGSDVRHVGDPTPQERTPGSSWHDDAMRVIGILDRWSRKR